MMYVFVVVCVVLLQYTSGVPIMKRPGSNIFSRTSRIHKRSSAVVEFFMNHESYSSIARTSDHAHPLVTASKDAHNYDFICPKTVSTGINDPIYKRSTCPWYYSSTHDPTRFPAVILKAEPLCDYAIGSNGMHECIPLTHTIDILKQQKTLDQDNNYVWLETTMSVVSGFTSGGRRLGNNAASPTTTTPTTASGGAAPWAKR